MCLTLVPNKGGSGVATLTSLRLRLGELEFETSIVWRGKRWLPGLWWRGRDFLHGYVCQRTDVIVF